MHFLLPYDGQKKKLTTTWLIFWHVHFMIKC